MRHGIAGRKLGRTTSHRKATLANMAVALAVGVWWFRVELAGSLWLLLTMSLVFLMSSLGQGLLISTVSQTQGQAMQLAIFVLLPAFLLSGFIFPRETMPLPLHDVGYLVPLTYFLKILRGLILKGVDLGVLWVDVLPLAALGALLFALSAWRFRKQLV